MNLEEIYNQIEELENKLNYYKSRLEEIKTLVSPQSMQYDTIIVDGGIHVDTISKYVELEDQNQLKATINYIQKKLKNLNDLKDKEIIRLTKYGETVKAVVYLREKEFRRDTYGKKRHLTWEEIGRKAYCSPRSARYWYKLATEERKKSA